jgi:hypothetical protein
MDPNQGHIARTRFFDESDQKPVALRHCLELGMTACWWRFGRAGQANLRPDRLGLGPERNRGI